MNIGKRHIRTKKSLRKILKKKPKTESETKTYYYLNGILDSSICGICIYNESPSVKFN